jgi:type IV secretory pathway VirB10-like protein
LSWSAQGKWRLGAGGGTRTHTTLPSRDFKSLASTNSATSASLISIGFLPRTCNVRQPTSLAAAGIPHDVPPLGPPLPGDLGRPIVAAQSSSAPDSLAIDPEQLRVNQETRAARTSKVFANTNVRPPSSEGPSNVTMSTDEAFTQNRQDRKRAFLNASADRRPTSPDRLVRTSIDLCCSGGTVSRRLSSRNPV